MDKQSLGNSIIFRGLRFSKFFVEIPEKTSGTILELKWIESVSKVVKKNAIRRSCVVSFLEVKIWLL